MEHTVVDFRSKEAFGVALLEHHYTGYLQRLVDHFDHGEGISSDRSHTSADSFTVKQPLIMPCWQN
jgi:hypothetical protein